MTFAEVEADCSKFYTPKWDELPAPTKAGGGHGGFAHNRAVMLTWASRRIEAIGEQALRRIAHATSNIIWRSSDRHTRALSAPHKCRSILFEVTHTPESDRQHLAYQIERSNWAKRCWADAQLKSEPVRRAL
jgi:hypothetical protein